jgi:gentisate 1,2-dioxygenase
MMSELGKLEDLPQEYRDALTKLNLVPLWPSLRGVMPANKPRPHTVPTLWKYQDIKPLLLQAGELTPIEKAERRVLVLANPGHTLEKMQASPAMYLGMQLLLPGEWAASHRHTPNAIRMIVEGEGAYTTVEGEKCYMSRGDLILTPTGLWHEHGHDGQDPVVWLDVLDLPLAYYLEVSYHNDGVKQEHVNESTETFYTSGGVVPSPMFERSKKQYPMYRYPWTHVRQTLENMAQVKPSVEMVSVTYVNPETGDDAENILGFYAMMLRPNQAIQLPVRSPSIVFHVIEGACEIQIESNNYSLLQADTCCVPGYTPVTLKNSLNQPTFLFMTDETPLHRKLGVFENRTKK